MDNLHGQFPDHEGPADSADYYDDDLAHEPPPSPVGLDERRMQVRAYNFWASLLDNRNFPSIEDLEPEAIPDFGPYSVLLDFTSGIENPGIPFLGQQLAAECGADAGITVLDDVPSRSLLSRITDHYMQILANQAPIGFEAEFVNQRGSTILYRGILLPFSSDDDTIDFIYGVINWKELADQHTADELLLEIDQVLDARAPGAGPQRADSPLTEWADGPSDDDPNVSDLHPPFLDGHTSQSADTDWPMPSFASLSGDDEPENGYDEDYSSADGDYAPALITGPEAAAMGLADWLAAARELAHVARTSEDRTRHALYAAIGRAYDFALAAQALPEEFAEIVADAGLTVQKRAPLTPLVKLVFGADYDKTRLAEYATAIAHAQRLDLPRGDFAAYLDTCDGGLKGVVKTERSLKRAESDASGRESSRETPREMIARKLRKLEPVAIEDVARSGSEFTLLIARRTAAGTVEVLGEADKDVALIERAARQLLG